MLSSGLRDSPDLTQNNNTNQRQRLIIKSPMNGRCVRWDGNMTKGNIRLNQQPINTTHQIAAEHVTFSGVKDLQDARDVLGVGSNDVTLRHGSNVEDFVQIQNEDGVCVLLLHFRVVEEDFLGGDDHVLLSPSVSADVLLGRNRKPAFQP